MQFNLNVSQPNPQIQCCQVIGLFEEGTFTQAAQCVDTYTNGYITRILEKKRFSGKLSRTLSLFECSANHEKFTHLLLVGCGKSQGLRASEFQTLITSVIRALNMSGVEEAVLYLSELTVYQQTYPNKIKYIVQIANEAIYCFDQFKSDKQTLPSITLNKLTIALPDAVTQKACVASLAQGIAIAAGVKYAKDLANLPGNICTPHFLANAAQELAKEYPTTITTHVLDAPAMQKLNMGALLAVAKGSVESPQLICIEYNNIKKKGAPIILVGKGVSFDSGGLSLKSHDNMVGMKYDMSGAAAVLGTVMGAAILSLPLYLVGIIPAVENMPGGKAYRPEDILHTASGQTVEVISTDAEGRLILSDALTYCERYQPEIVIDIATLTGAVVIALGHQVSGLFSNHELLAKALLAAGEESVDRAWQLPLYEEYQQQINSPFADMKNTGGRSAGTITAACFLSRFAKNFNWAHLDVAGTAAMMSGANERMATGRPVPLLLQYLINKVQSDVSSPCL